MVLILVSQKLPIRLEILLNSALLLKGEHTD
jgi:hypothetical protein